MGCVSEHFRQPSGKRGSFWKRYWFLAFLILMIPVGLAYPEGGLTIKQTKWMVPTFVGVMMAISGFTLDTVQLHRQAVHFKAILPVLCSTYLVAPAAAYGLALIFQPEGSSDFVPAMMIMAVQASSLASALALTVLSHGNRELALILTLASNSLTFLLTPLALKLSIGTEVEVPVGHMMIKMLLVVILPVVAGQWLRHFFWERAQPMLDAVRLAPQLIILMFVYTGFSAATGQIQGNGNVVLRILAACALLHMLLLGWNWLMAVLLRMDRPTTTAMVYCGSQKTLPNGIYIWEQYFADNPFGAVPLALYHLFQLIVDTLLVPLFEKSNRAEE